MSDHDAVEPTPKASSSHSSRRSVLRAGLLALSAAQLPDLAYDSLLAEPSPTTPEQFGRFVQAELAKYEQVVKRSGATVD